MKTIILLLLLICFSSCTGIKKAITVVCYGKDKCGNVPIMKRTPTKTEWRLGY